MRDWDDTAASSSRGVAAAYDENDDQNSPAEDLAAIARASRGEIYGHSASLSPNPQPHEPQRSAPPGNGKKAKLHRKRHVPVGPAGVWFQANHRGGGGGGGSSLQRHSPRFRQQEERGHGAGNDRRSESPGDDVGGSGDDELHRHRTAYGYDAMGMTQTSGDDKSPKSSAGGLSLCSPAWMCMQCDLGLVLPAIPPNVPMSATERATMLRRCLPPHYRLLPDLVRRDATQWRLHNRKVLVLVQTLQSLTDNLWTVKVTDETLVSLTAWIEPALVRQEQQRPQPKYVRPGLVWLLSNPTTILVGSDGHRHDNDLVGDGDNINQQSSAERMLLVSEETIERVWAPSQANAVPDDTFVAWLEKRNVVSASVMEAWEGERRTSPTQPNRQFTESVPPSGRSSDRPHQRSFEEEDEVEDRAPLESVHESDDEEFMLQLSQVPPMNKAAVPFSRLVQAHPSRHNTPIGRLSPLGARGLSVSPNDPAAAQRTFVEAGTKAQNEFTAVRSQSVYNNENRGLELLDSRQAFIPPSNPGRDQPQSCNSTRVLQQSTSATTCRSVVNADMRSPLGEPHPPLTANSPVLHEPARIAQLPDCRQNPQTFGFSQFLSQPANDHNGRPELAGKVNCKLSSQAVAPEVCTTPPPPAGSYQRDSAVSSSTSRKKRKKRSPFVGHDKSPTIQTSSTPKVPSKLWSHQADGSNLLELFDDDDDDDDVERLFPSRKPKVAPPVLNSLPQLSLFDNLVGLNVHDMFSDDEG